MQKGFFPIFSCLVLAMTTIVMTSCDKRSRFENIVKEQSKQLPIEVAEGLTFERMDYDKEANVLSFTYALDSDDGQFIFSSISTDYLRNRMSSILSTMASEKFMKDVLEVEAALRFIYYVKGTNKTMDMTLSPGEIKSIINGKTQGAYTPAQILDNEIKAANKAVPLQIEGDLYFTKMSDEGRYVVLEYTFYDNDIDWDYFRNNKDEIRADMNIKEEKGMSFDMNILKQLNKGLIIRYKDGNTQQSGDIVFETNEI